MRDPSGLNAEPQPGRALARAFYADPAIFERDVEAVFLRCWLYVGHASEIPHVGDYLLFEVAGESVIVVRDAGREVRALLNVCRHRGSRVCIEARGRARTLTCPYHGWTYDLDGRLRSGRYLPEGFDMRAHGLDRLRVEVYHGLIFVSFAPDPPGFAPLARALDDGMRPFALARARVAHRALYPIEANWKLAVENYIECYHCAVAHREYSRSHSRQAPAGEAAAGYARLAERAREVGIVACTVDTSWPASPGETEQYFFERYPLYDGFVTGSEDGAPLAPLLGDLRGYDGGATDVQIGPVTFLLLYSDHAVVYRFTPRSVRCTDCEITWLVHERAEAGVDYDPQRLTWLWDVTTAADKRIIDHNQAGVGSRFYRPGPYSGMEGYPARFVRWYLSAIG